MIPFHSLKKRDPLRRPSRIRPIMVVGVILILVFLATSESSFGQLTEPSGPIVRRVVIDPGHGGDNLGVVGPSGYTESRLTLELARELKTALEKEEKLLVFLTRDEGRNPSPINRTARANAMRADLLLSLHAGGPLGSKRPGPRIYFHDYRYQIGSPDEDDSATRRYIGAVNWDEAQAQYLGKARMLARGMKKSINDVLHINIKDPVGLPVAILVGAQQPALLIEVGSLSDAEEERRLKAKGYRSALTQALVRAIRSWRQMLRQEYDD